MALVRSIATHLRAEWCGLMRSSGRLNCFLALALAGTLPVSPGHCNWSIFRPRARDTRSHENLGSIIFATPVDPKRKGKDSLNPAWCGGRNPREKRCRAILGKLSSQAIAEAEATVRVDLVHLLHTSSFDGYALACAAHHDAR